MILRRLGKRIYASRSPATATLEILLHANWRNLPHDYTLTCLEVPEAATRYEPDPGRFPPDWRLVDEHPHCQDLGTEWLRSVRSLLLIVPSVVVPEERNVLLNPLHPELEGVRIVSVQPYTFDPRLGRFLFATPLTRRTPPTVRHLAREILRIRWLYMSAT